MTHPNLEKLAVDLMCALTWKSEDDVRANHMKQVELILTALRQVREQTVEACASVADNKDILDYELIFKKPIEYTEAVQETFCQIPKDIAKAIRQLAQDNGKE